MDVDIFDSKLIIRCPKCNTAYTMHSELSLKKDYNNVKCYQCGKIVDMIFIKGSHTMSRNPSDMD